MDRREKLIRAARQLLHERGYEATSPRAIQEKAGAGQGSFYHHFPGKKALALAVLEQVREELTQAANSQFDRPERPLQRVLCFLEQEREGLRGCRLGRLAQEASVLEDRDLRRCVAGYFEDLEQMLGAALDEAVAASEIPPLDTAALARTLAATVQGGYVLARAGGDERELTRATGGLATLLRALGRDRGARR
ncbi:MAG: TetR family transcriptional regulator [Candidatus Eisenbacteria bacterium]